MRKNKKLIEGTRIENLIDECVSIMEGDLDEIKREVNRGDGSLLPATARIVCEYTKTLVAAHKALPDDGTDLDEIDKEDLEKALKQIKSLKKNESKTK